VATLRVRERAVCTSAEAMEITFDFPMARSATAWTASQSSHCRQCAASAAHS
jgi:hypothetical protein